MQKAKKPDISSKKLQGEGVDKAYSYRDETNLLGETMRIFCSEVVKLSVNKTEHIIDASKQ